jgi:hypothetical protein
MERERPKQDAFDPQESRQAPVTMDRDETVFVDLVQEALPDSDEAVRRSLAGHQTEGQGE